MGLDAMSANEEGLAVVPVEEPCWWFLCTQLTGLCQRCRGYPWCGRLSGARRSPLVGSPMTKELRDMGVIGSEAKRKRQGQEKENGKGTSKITIRSRKDCETRDVRPQEDEHPNKPRERLMILCLLVVVHPCVPFALRNH